MKVDAKHRGPSTTCHRHETGSLHWRLTFNAARAGAFEDLRTNRLDGKRTVRTRLKTQVAATNLTTILVTLERNARRWRMKDRRRRHRVTERDTRISRLEFSCHRSLARLKRSLQRLHVVKEVCVWDRQDGG
jgi:hypothetical protein